MVHLRLNERDTQRNPHINFVRALPGPDAEEAARRLEQVAAVYKPVMAAYGFRLNSLEEFPFNREFAGRNWNAGETIELVLRTQDGGWAPFLAVAHVMAHELAHILHMNHLPPHGRLTSEIQSKVRSLLREGYFGDGFWSAGYRLGDKATVLGDANPEAMVRGYANQLCGGAQRGRVRGRGMRGRGRGRGPGRGTGRGGSLSARPDAHPESQHDTHGHPAQSKPQPKAAPKRKRGFQGPSLHTGAQTAPNTSRTASKRTRKALPGEGQRLDGAPIEPPKRDRKAPDAQSFFRRLERLAAIESRLRSDAGPDTDRGLTTNGIEAIPGPMDGHAMPSRTPGFGVKPDHESKPGPEPRPRSASRPDVIELD